MIFQELSKDEQEKKVIKYLSSHCRFYFRLKKAERQEFLNHLLSELNNEAYRHMHCGEILKKFSSNYVLYMAKVLITRTEAL